MAHRPVTSVADLNSNFELLKPKILLPENEDSWEFIAKSLVSFTNLCQNGACDFPIELISIIRSISRPMTNSLMSERTRLSGVAIDLISTVAAELGKSFERLLPIFMPPLLTMCGRTNKVIIARAKACIMTIIEASQLPSILVYFQQSVKDKSTSIRLVSAEGTLTCMNCFNPPDLEKDSRALEIELIIRTTARDAQGEIRALGRKLFEAYQLLLPNRVERFTSPLSPTVKKYLDIKASHRSQPQVPLTTPNFDAKKPFSSSTSVISSSRGRADSRKRIAHVRSASSSAALDDLRTVDHKTNQVTGVVRKATKSTLMPPPPFIPIRLTQPTNAAYAYSASSVARRTRVVSTSAIREYEATATLIRPTESLGRSISANSYGGDPHRLQTILPAAAGPSGPRRVPIQAAPPKSAEAKQQSATTRPRIQPTAYGPPHGPSMSTRVNVPIAPAREKAKSIPKVQKTHPKGLGPAEGSEKTQKLGGVMQPTLSQLARAKANLELKHENMKHISGYPISGSNTVTTLIHRNVKPRIQKAVQPIHVPLPPSPMQSSTLLPSYDEESSPPLSSDPFPITFNPSIREPGEEVSPQSACTSKCHEEYDVVTISQDSTVHPLTVADTTLESHGYVTEEQVTTPDGNRECTQDGESAMNSKRTTIMAPLGAPTEIPTTPYPVLSSDSVSDNMDARTPISSLLSSIQRGFLFTPSSPLSPPQSYSAREHTVQETSVPFPLDIDRNIQNKRSQDIKPFVFGVRLGDYEGSLQGNVENVNVHN